MVSTIGRLAYPFADLTLAQRLERVEAKSNADFVEAHARVDPDGHAGWIDVDGTYAMYDGAGSPLTQTFGLGVLGAATDDALARIEAFFHERGAEVFHEVSPLADPSTLERLHARGYYPVEHSTVLVRPLPSEPDPHSGSAVRVRLVEKTESGMWAEISEHGWSESPEAAAFMKNFAAVMMECRCSKAFVAEIDGKPVATGALNLHDGVALLAGASTVPEYRRRGAQNALLEARLRYAASCGCNLAMMVALPGSGSQKNAERAGFRIVYTRTKWRLGR